MVGVTKLRIKFGPGGSVKTCQMVPVKNVEESESKKRGPSELEEVQAKKKQKLDRGLSSQCLTLLRLFSDHKLGWIFNEPVDPVKLKIPDYLSVVSKPMDLGTIKSKLLRNLYNSADEFAADVRLTFTNAMLYNPPQNGVHQVAKELKDIFEARWESFNKTKVEDGSKRQPASAKMTKPVKDKSEKVSSLKGQSQKGTPKSRIEQGLGVNSTVKIPSKGSAPTAACKCGRITCVCLNSCNSSASEQSSVTDCQIMNAPAAQASASDPQSLEGSVNSRDGCVTSQLLDNPSHSASTCPATPPLPPEKALRAVMLKSQFAEAILRAKHRKVLDQNNKADLIRIQMEKEQMEKAHRQEKARIEAEMEAAKLAARMRAKAELNEQRERERLKLEKVQSTSGLLDNNFELLDKDLVYLCGSSRLTRKPLLELGLFLRNHYCPKMELELAMDDMRVDLEEGEIS